MSKLANMSISSPSVKGSKRKSIAETMAESRESNSGSGQVINNFGPNSTITETVIEGKKKKSKSVQFDKLSQPAQLATIAVGTKGDSMMVKEYHMKDKHGHELDAITASGVVDGEPVALAAVSETDPYCGLKSCPAFVLFIVFSIIVLVYSVFYAISNIPSGAPAKEQMKYWVMAAIMFLVILAIIIFFAWMIKKKCDECKNGASWGWFAAAIIFPFVLGLLYNVFIGALKGGNTWLSNWLANRGQPCPNPGPNPGPCPPDEPEDPTIPDEPERHPRNPCKDGNCQKCSSCGSKHAQKGNKPTIPEKFNLEDDATNDIKNKLAKVNALKNQTAV